MTHEEGANGPHPPRAEARGSNPFGCPSLSQDAAQDETSVASVICPPPSRVTPMKMTGNGRSERVELTAEGRLIVALRPNRFGFDLDGVA